MPSVTGPERIKHHLDSIRVDRESYNCPSKRVLRRKTHRRQRLGKKNSEDGSRSELPQLFTHSEILILASANTRIGRCVLEFSLTGELPKSNISHRNCTVSFLRATEPPSPVLTSTIRFRTWKSCAQHSAVLNKKSTDAQTDRLLVYRFLFVYTKGTSQQYRLARPAV